jgi:hypothetical protein
MANKICTMCDFEKPLNYFYGNRRNKDGKDTHCKSCAYERKQKYRVPKEILEKRKSLSRLKLLERRKKYYQENKEKCLVAKNLCYKNNREKYYARQKEYAKENSQQRAAYRAKRRSIELKSTLTLAKQYSCEIEGLYLYAKLFGGHVDHVVPLINSQVCGLHVPWNMKVIDVKENLKKSNIFHIGKYPEQGLLGI